MKQFRYLAKLAAFAYKAHPLFFACALLALLSVGIELLAMSYLFPISSLASNVPPSENSLPLRIFKWLGLDPSIRRLLLVFIILILIRITTQVLAQGLTLLLSKKLQAELSSLGFESVISVISISDIERKSIGHYMVLAGEEASRASNLILMINQFINSGALAILYFLAIANYSMGVGAAVLAFLAFTFLCLLDSFLRSQSLGARQLDEGKAATSFFVDSLNNLRSIRALGAEEYVKTSYRKHIFQYVRTAFDVEMLNVLGRSVPAMILLAACGIWVFAATSVAGANFSFTVTIIVFMLRFFPVIGQCLNIFLRIVADAKAGTDISEVLDLIRLRPVESLGENLIGCVESIEIANVSFSYNGTDPVLKNFSAIFKKNRSYSIFGPSGAGKSTLTDLLVQFYPLERGRIEINGHDLSKISPISNRKKILVVGQQTAIFNDTVWNNIAVGASISEKQMQRACELACVDEVIRSLPLGYQTILNYQGTNLSGGQRQRIGLARALLRQADVLILDESTNALDADTRESVVGNILEDYKERTVIFITHDTLVTGMVDEVIHLDSARDDVKQNAVLQ